MGHTAVQELICHIQCCTSNKSQMTNYFKLTHKQSIIKEEITFVYNSLTLFYSCVLGHSAAKGSHSYNSLTQSI